MISSSDQCRAICPSASPSRCSSKFQGHHRGGLRQNSPLSHRSGGAFSPPLQWSLARGQPRRRAFPPSHMRALLTTSKEPAGGMASLPLLVSPWLVGWFALPLWRWARERTTLSPRPLCVFGTAGQQQHYLTASERRQRALLGRPRTRSECSLLSIPHCHPSDLW